ncbi:MmcB family DNA repair protein [Maricaulis sp.]|uniref:MmcB family DNA repair protein n=1 Tax=Maricaulis sp. TaxID=1486257 RepID=UPI0025BF4E0A|nr:MmcB family DNA repair protein [Maricaulis sp.]
MSLDDVASAANPQIDDAQALMRGAARLLWHMGFSAIPEFILPDGRRADLAALGRKGEITIIEIKSGIADFRADSKWTNYSGYCDRLYFAVSQRFPHDVIPEEAGLIIADGFGGAIVRESPVLTLAPARRKALTLRFARAAADRLMRTGEPGSESNPVAG